MRSKKTDESNKKAIRKAQGSAKITNLKNALVIDLDGESKKLALKAWEQLRNHFEIKFISSRSPCPHITLESDFEVLNHKQFKTRLSVFCKTQPSFFLDTRGLGIFVVDSPVIYIRWRKNNNLNLLKNNLSEFLELAQKDMIIKNYSVVEDWAPKTTLAYNDSQYECLGDIIQLFRFDEFKNSMKVRSISLYEYSNELGEKNLDKFYFNSYS